MPRTRFRIHGPVIALASLALVAAGCGGDDDDNGGESKAPATTTPAPAKTEAAGGSSVKEDMTEFKFSDPNPSVKAGTVTFEVKNAGTTTHALEVEGPGGEEKTGNMNPGASKSLKVDLSKPGKYEFYCPVANHRDLGMEGDVTVK